MYKGFWGKIYAVLKLMRWFHEVVAVLPFISLFIVINYHAKQNSVQCQLSVIDFVVLCVCVQALIAAGCVLNDIADRKIDKINKPKTHIIDNAISLKGAWVLFASLSVLIALLSWFISFFMFTEWVYISVAVYGTSFAYDYYLKRSPFFGNLFMGLITAFIPLVLLFYAKDCIALLNNEKITLLIYLYAALPFLIIVPRELSLDISDMEGDRAAGCRTLPIIIGVKRARTVVMSLLALVPLLSVLLLYRYGFLWPALLLVNVLLVIYALKFKSVASRIEYIKLGRFLWAIMIAGLIAFTLLCF